MNRVIVYDNGGETFDRYTILFLKREYFAGGYYYNYVGSSTDPFHPQGFYQHGEMSASTVKDLRSGQHDIGKVIPFKSLPEAVQRAVNAEK